MGFWFFCKFFEDSVFSVLSWFWQKFVLIIIYLNNKTFTLTWACNGIKMNSIEDNISLDVKICSQKSHLYHCSLDRKHYTMFSRLCVCVCEGLEALWRCVWGPDGVRPQEVGCVYRLRRLLSSWELSPLTNRQDNLSTAAELVCVGISVMRPISHFAVC